MPQIISQVQGAFILSRLISDNTIFAPEIAQTLFKQKMGKMGTWLSNLILAKPTKGYSGPFCGMCLLSWVSQIGGPSHYGVCVCIISKLLMNSIPCGYIHSSL